MSVISREDLAKLPLGRDMVSVLDLHNQAREDVGSPPLQWNLTLAEHAQEYANVLAETGRLRHSSRVGRENERENLVAGPRAGNTPLGLARVWLDERRDFRVGIFPDVCAGDWSKCAHYTQMIWSTTTDLGCGFASKAYDVLVCRYSPPGNRDGRPVITISRPAAR
ncbi:CAP domain-containing protein [Altererythrobacter sp. Root672]|uniref:CAP domain-containing protein n=1 Tax=Altererythrobacter sp. Root672 TaxID=1736584 RepID=UPI0006FCEED9|nr:CAP domain-containing protein [Altererythrobacter sp. Root672]KRA82934.1 hypothetical protein ASD76_02275 [Altererythrobacter sp. Root672]